MILFFFPLNDPSYEISKKISDFIESVFLVLALVTESLKL